MKKRQENEHRQASCSHSSLVDNLEESDSEDCSANDGDTSYSNVRVESAKKRKAETAGGKMRIKLPALSETCDGYAISDRSAAAISSAVLQDIGVITNDDKASVIDRSKIRRQRLKKREEAQSNIDNCVNGLFFDGRKDKTMTQVRELDGKLHRRKKVKEHICLINEPGSSYFGHITVERGTAKGIVDGIITCLETRSVDTSRITSVGCDGTAVNTGHIGGAIRPIEEYVQWP